MLDTEEVLHIIMLSTMTSSAMAANTFYVFVIKTKTPKNLSSYANILFNIACVDFLAALCSFMCIASLQNVGGRMVFVYLGPCTALNEHWCHRFFAGHANFVVQSVLLLLTSFAYRLRVLKTDSEHQLRHGKLWTAFRIVILALALPNTLLLSFVGTYEVPGLSLKRTISVYNLSGGLSDNLFTRCAVLNNLLLYFIGFVTILLIRRKLFFGIIALSSSDRYNHQLIYRSLTAQMMLPLAYVFGTSLWLLDVVGLIHSQALQRSILILSSLFALVSPLINLYYIPPYRKYLQSLYAPNKLDIVQDLTQFSRTTQIPDSRC